MFKDGGECKVAYPLKHGKKVAGRSFHNGRFVMRMREKLGTVPG
jgi:squalene monooxygenase